MYYLIDFMYGFPLWLKQFFFIIIIIFLFLFADIHICGHRPRFYSFLLGPHWLGWRCFRESLSGSFVSLLSRGFHGCRNRRHHLAKHSPFAGLYTYLLRDHSYITYVLEGGRGVREYLFGSFVSFLSRGFHDCRNRRYSLT